MKQFTPRELLAAVGLEWAGGLEEVQKESLLAGGAPQGLEERLQTFFVRVVGREMDKRFTGRRYAGFDFFIHAHGALIDERGKRRQKIALP